MRLIVEDEQQENIQDDKALAKSQDTCDKDDQKERGENEVSDADKQISKEADKAKGDVVSEDAKQENDDNKSAVASAQTKSDSDTQGERKFNFIDDAGKDVESEAAKAKKDVEGESRATEGMVAESEETTEGAAEGAEAVVEAEETTEEGAAEGTEAVVEAEETTEGAAEGAEAVAEAEHTDPGQNQVEKPKAMPAGEGAPDEDQATNDDAAALAKEQNASDSTDQKERDENEVSDSDGELGGEADKAKKELQFTAENAQLFTAMADKELSQFHGKALNESERGLRHEHVEAITGKACIALAKQEADADYTAMMEAYESIKTLREGIQKKYGESARKLLRSINSQF